MRNDAGSGQFAQLYGGGSVSPSPAGEGAGGWVLPPSRRSGPYAAHPQPGRGDGGPGPRRCVSRPLEDRTRAHGDPARPPAQRDRLMALEGRNRNPKGRTRGGPQRRASGARRAAQHQPTGHRNPRRPSRTPPPAAEDRTGSGVGPPSARPPQALVGDRPFYVTWAGGHLLLRQSASKGARRPDGPPRKWSVSRSIPLNFP